MGKRLSPFTEISTAFAETIGKRDEFIPYEHAIPSAGAKSENEIRQISNEFDDADLVL